MENLKLMIAATKAVLVGGDSSWDNMIECQIEVGFIGLRKTGDVVEFDALTDIINGFNSSFTVFDVMDISGYDYVTCAWVMYELRNIGLLKKVDAHSALDIDHYSSEVVVDDAVCDDCGVQAANADTGVCDDCDLIRHPVCEVCGMELTSHAGAEFCNNRECGLNKGGNYELS